MTRVLIIDGHPDASSARFVHALANAYADAAQGRHEVRRLDLASLDFPILRRRSDWQDGPAPPAIVSAQEAIRWADHIVILFPLWLGDMPALLKAFFEQVARPGFAFRYGKGLPEKLLKGRSARIVVTMGMPGLFYRFVYRAHSLKSLKRNILQFVGISPVRISVVGAVEGDAKRRSAWLERMKALGRRAA
ncbi:MAG TPA: NAD(P)H-dependent oxidoreductase [Allosphingosinicella sp.]|nr:NAD(P)H-dependent oxidoreductase [Allosphingosinicella sp.]